MSNTINNGGPAFPFTEHNANGGLYREQPGMTLRDYFAAKTMQAIITGETKRLSATFVAQSAYELADAMLRARGEA